MAVTATVSNKIKYLLLKALEEDTLKCCLMNTTFTFDEDAHHYYSDISSDELADGNGYTTGGQTLTGVTITENDSADRADLSCNNPTWTASGGSVGATGAAIVYDDTLSGKPILGCIDFGVDNTVASGENFLISTVTFRLA